MHAYIHTHTNFIHYVYHCVAETVNNKGDSLDAYMKSVKEKVDKGSMYDIKLQINKLKKVNNCVYVL